MDAYVDALCVEIRQVGERRRQKIKTIYLGGGTPSLLPSEAINQIVQSVRSNFLLSEQAEISMEANPDTVDSAYLSAVRQSGVNRLSFGAQSAIPAELALLEREHDFETVVRAVEMSRAAGFENISLDMIYGLPGQSLKSWEKSLQAALNLSPNHLSLYALTIELGTPLQGWLKRGQIQAPNPDLAADQYELACRMLERVGYDHYEISNWALPNQACQHNMSYWHNEAYLGLGAGAHGHGAGYRYWIVKQPRVYIRRMHNRATDRYPWSPAVAGKQQLTRDQAVADTMITQLRLLNEGMDLVAFENNFGMRPHEIYPGIIEQLMDWGLLREETQRLLLSKKGQLLSNQVFYRFM